MTKRTVPAEPDAGDPKPPAKRRTPGGAAAGWGEPPREVTPEEILASCPPGVRRIAEEVRSLVRHVVPAVMEKAYPSQHGIGFRDPQAGHLFGLFPQADHIRLFFERGAELDDPDGVFVPGEGLKQGRYVELRTVLDAKKPSLRRMIIRAVVNQSA